MDDESLHQILSLEMKKQFSCLSNRIYGKPAELTSDTSSVSLKSDGSKGRLIFFKGQKSSPAER